MWFNSFLFRDKQTQKTQFRKMKRKWTYDSKFRIRKKSRTDLFRKLVNKSLFELDISKKYVLEAKNEKSKLIVKLVKILESLFQSGEIYKIELRTEKHHFETFDKLLAE